MELERLIEILRACGVEGESPHLGISRGCLDGIKYFLTAGSTGRAVRLLEGAEVAATVGERAFIDRGLFWGTGVRDDVTYGVFSSGMGPASMEITLATDILPYADPRATFVRVGTAGTVQPDVRTGMVAIATHALRAESVSDKYLPMTCDRGTYLPTATPEVVAALVFAAELHGVPYVVGPKLTKDALGWEIGAVPDTLRAREASRIAERAGLVASSMESSALYTMLDHAGMIPGLPSGTRRWGTVVAIVNDPGAGTLFSDSAQQRTAAETRAILVGQEAARILVAYDAGKLPRLAERARAISSMQQLIHPQLVEAQRGIRGTYG